MTALLTIFAIYAGISLCLGVAWVGLCLLGGRRR